MRTPETSRETFSPEEMVNASELREFLFCERAWFLTRSGLEVTPAAMSQRMAGIDFHDARASAAVQGQKQHTYAWLLLVAAAAMALSAAVLWMRSQ